MATIRKRNGKYEAQVRRSGQPHVSRSFLGRKEAQQWARQMELAADRHDLPAAIDRKALGVTLGALVARYRETVSPRKRAGDNEQIVLNAFALHPICRKTVGQLRVSDFAAYRDERLKTVKPISLKRELSIIHHLFETARTEWDIPLKENPVATLRFKAASVRRERRLKDGELEALLAAAAEKGQTTMADLLRFAIETGMRRGELLGIRWGDISDLSLHIPLTKNGEPRTIPLTPTAVAILKARRPERAKDTDRVFNWTGNALRLAWQRLRKRAGSPDLHFHDLRHEATSRLFELGLTAPEVALVTGHKTLAMLSRYSHAQRRVIAEKFATAGCFAVPRQPADSL